MTKLSDMTVNNDTKNEEDITSSERYKTRSFDHLVILLLTLLTVFIGVSEFISGHYAVFTLSIVTFLFLIFICFSRPLFLSFEKNKVRIKNIIGSKEVNYKDIELVKIQRIKNRKGDNNHALVLILLDGTKVYLGSNFLKPSEDLKSILDKHMHAIKEKHSEVS